MAAAIEMHGEKYYQPTSNHGNALFYTHHLCANQGLFHAMIVFQILDGVKR